MQAAMTPKRAQPFVAEFRRLIYLLASTSLLLCGSLTYRMLVVPQLPMIVQRLGMVPTTRAHPTTHSASATPIYRYCKHQEGYFDRDIVDLTHQHAPCITITQRESLLSVYQLSRRYSFDDYPAWNITVPDEVSSPLYYLNHLPLGHVYAIYHTQEHDYGVIQVQHYYCTPRMHRGSLNASMQQFLEQAAGPDTLELRVIGPEAVGWVMRPVLDKDQWMSATIDTDDSIDKCVYSTRYDVSIAGQYNLFVHSIDHQYTGAAQCDTGMVFCTNRMAMRPQMAVLLNETRQLIASSYQPMLSQSNFWPRTESDVQLPRFDNAHVKALPPLAPKFGRWVHKSQLNTEMISEYKLLNSRRAGNMPERPLCSAIGDLRQYHFIPYQYDAAGHYQPQTSISSQRPYTVEDVDSTCLRGNYLFHGDSQTRTTFDVVIGGLLNKAEYKTRKQRAGLNDTLQSDCIEVNPQCDFCYGADLHELDNNWTRMFMNMGQHPASFYVTMDWFANVLQENFDYMPVAFQKQQKIIWMEGVAHPDMWIESYFS